MTLTRGQGHWRSKGQNREGSSSWLRRNRRQSQNTRASGPEIDKIKGWLDGGLRYPSVGDYLCVCYLTPSKIVRPHGGIYGLWLAK